MSDHAKGRVAVIMTCYNEAPYIGAAVRSVLGQSRADVVDRIIIADDGSANDTIATLKAIETWDDRITVIYGPGGAGIPVQRNLAIARTNSEFFAILDGDDLWAEDKLEKQLPQIQADQNVGLVYSDYFTFSNDDLSGARRAGVGDLSTSANLTRTYFLNDPPIIPSTILVRRAVYEACGRFDESIRVFEDTDFYIRVSRISTFKLVNLPLLYKRFHASSITGGGKDLIGHHALVAFKAAAAEPSLMPLVTRRLSERARKLGNHVFLLGDNMQAIRLLRLSVQLDPLNFRGWVFLIAAMVLKRLPKRFFASRLEARRTALGATNQ